MNDDVCSNITQQGLALSFFKSTLLFAEKIYLMFFELHKNKILQHP